MELRCRSCSHSLGNTPAPVALVALLSTDVQLGRTHPDEVRRRCHACTWINVFQPILPPLALSIVLHALIALLFVVASVRAPQPAATPFEVQILRPEEAARAKAQSRNQDPAKAAAEQPVAPPKKQIVSPSDSPEQKPDQARLFSDRDSRAIEETIKHGEPAPPAKPPQEIAKPQSAKAAADDQAATKSKGDAHGAKLGSALAESNPKSSLPSTQTAPPVGLGDLFVRPSELAHDPALLKGESGERDQTADGGKRDLAMLSRPDLWADPGRRGSPDYLPNVRDGNVTMLNAKADRFAPFVRRVGLRVFQAFSMEFKQQIRSGAVPDGKDESENYEEFAHATTLADCGY